MCVLFCVCVCRETMQQPGCTTSEPCFWARDLNFWRKTWPSWTGWRGDWQVGHRPPRLTRRCTIRGTDQGTAQPSGAQTPAPRQLDKMDLVTSISCLWESREGGSGLQPSGPSVLESTDWWSHRSLSCGEQKGMAGWRPPGAPCVALSTSALLQHAQLL